MTTAPARHRGLFWLATLLAVLAVVGGGYFAISTYLSSAEPGQVAVAYFTAVARGDAPKALSYGVVPSGDRSFLTSDVLHQQLAAGSISSVQVLSVAENHGRTAQVNVSYQLRHDGDSHVVTDTVPMIHKQRHWWLAAVAVSTQVGLAEATHRASFAGTAFPSGAVLLFPGALPITFDTPNLELGAPDSSIQFTTTNNTNLAVEASPAGIGAARTAVGASLTACLAATSTNVFCPIPGNGSTTVRAVPGSLHGTLAAKATDGLSITVAPDANGLFKVEGTVLIDGSYLSLDYTNLASTVTDKAISVAISASCWSSSVSAVTWKTA